MEQINKLSLKDKLVSYIKHPASGLLALLVMLCALLTFTALIFLIAYILINGIPHIKPELFSWKYTTENVSMLPSIINTLIMTVISLIIAVPL